jgi:glycosyltransferase involved in cell wall biosynthesis
MNILYHHRTLATDAQGVHIRALMTAFRAAGHRVREVSLVSSEAGPVKDERGERKGLVAVLRRRLPRIAYELLEYTYTPYGLRKLEQAAREEGQVDLVYERYSLGNAAGVRFGRKHGVPVIVEVNAPLAREKAEHEGLFFTGVALRSERRILSSATRVIAVTGVLKRILVEEGVPDEKIVVMPNGVTRGEFDPAARGGELRARWGLAPDDVVVGFVGWFRAWHGLERLVDLAASAEARKARLAVVLAGDGPVRAELEKRIADLGVADRVKITFALERAEIPGVVSAFDIAVQPDVTEYACPMKLVEYMAAGRAVVAPDRENIRELVTDGVSALLFDPADPAALGRALLRLAGDNGLREKLARGGAEVVEKRGLSWEENARRVIGLVASTPPGRS